MSNQAELRKTISDAQAHQPAEERLRASEAKYRLLLDSIDEGFCIIEVLFDDHSKPVDYRFLEVNPAFVRQTGLQNARGRTMRELAPGHEAHWFETYGRIALRGEPERFENRAAALDNRWYDVYAFRLGEPEQRRVAILFNDVSERKRASDALRASEERFRLFVENVREYALVQTDLRGRVTSWNPGATRLFSYTAAEMLGQLLSRLLTPEDQRARVFDRDLASSQPRENERLLVRQSGERFWARWVTEPVTDQEGRVRGLAWILRNETDRKEAEQDRERLVLELERSNDELSRFSYAVSHDLQAPVRTIQAFAELLFRRTDRKLQPADLELLSNITDAAAGMQRLIHSLLQYAQAGEGRLKWESVDVSDVVAAVQGALASDIFESRSHVRCEALPVVRGDRIQLEQLFQNLMANAIRYRRPDTPLVITISGEAIEGGWRFAVADNGQGIPHESQEHIFEPLKRLHGSDVPGTGLGLALCRTIVERHGGRIWVESDGEDRGSAFRFVLAESSGRQDVTQGSTAT